MCNQDVTKNGYTNGYMNFDFDFLVNPLIQLSQNLLRCNVSIGDGIGTVICHFESPDTHFSAANTGGHRLVTS